MKWAEVIPYPDIVGSVIRVAMIRALADSLSYANAQLSMLDMQRMREENVDRQRAVVRRAAAGVETVSAARTHDENGNEIPSYLQ